MFTWTMTINWRAVFTGFAVSLVIGFVLAVLYPLTLASVWLLALPGLVGGFVAGYMVRGSGNGAVHGGLSTIIGGMTLVVVFAVAGILFVGLIPAIGGATVALLALFVQAIPGAVAGAVGAWTHGRRTPEPAVAT